MDRDMYDMDRLREPDEMEIQPGRYTFANASEPTPAPENEPAPTPAEQPHLELPAGTSTNSAQQADAAPEQSKPATPSRASQGKASQTAKAAGASGKSADQADTEVTYAGKAVIDRFEGKWAVLLVGDNEEKSVAVKKSSLPKHVQAGHWLNVKLGGKDGAEVVSAEVDPEETAWARQRIEEKLALLRSGTYLTQNTDQKPPQS